MDEQNIDLEGMYMSAVEDSIKDTITAIEARLKLYPSHICESFKLKPGDHINMVSILNAARKSFPMFTILLDGPTGNGDYYIRVGKI